MAKCKSIGGELDAPHSLQFARGGDTAWRSAVEARLLELETLVESWRELGLRGDDSGHRVSPLVWCVEWHAERIRAALEGRPQ